MEHDAWTSLPRRRGPISLLSALALCATVAAPAAAAEPTSTGPSSSASPYVVPVAPGVRTVSILTVGDSVDGYRMVGMPDGLGAFDNEDGTFTLFMNHELSAVQGVERRHGGIGAFVSRWVIHSDPEDLRVLSGQDQINKVYNWSLAERDYVLAQNEAFSRFCSADLPARSAFWDAETSTGWNGARFFLNGEETGPGSHYAHMVNGKSYEIIRMGHFATENALANPGSGLRTIVVGLNDSSPRGQVYVYVGTKTKEGGAIDRAGLTNGSLFGIKVAEILDEAATVNPLGTDDRSRFSLVELKDETTGDVTPWSATTLQTRSEAAGVTEFLRPEDGVWDPSNPTDLYFVTTASFTTPSRLWRARFDDLASPAAGGTLELLVEGTEGPRMMDNMTIDRHGHLLITEDTGAQPRLSTIWQYSIATDSVKAIAQSDPARFTPGAPAFMTQNEETSGIIDASEILGPGWFVFDVMVHMPLDDPELVEPGQLLALYNPDSAP